MKLIEASTTLWKVCSFPPTVFRFGSSVLRHISNNLFPLFSRDPKEFMSGWEFSTVLPYKQRAKFYINRDSSIEKHVRLNEHEALLIFMLISTGY